MPIIIAQVVNKTPVYNNFGHYAGISPFLVNISEIANRYRHWCTNENKIRSYVSRVFNEHFCLVSRPRTYHVFSIIDAADSQGQDLGYFIDVSNLVDSLSIPNGYFLEILATSFVGKWERIIFPFEVKVDAIKELKDQVESELGTLRKVSDVFEASSVFNRAGLTDIAEELSNGYSKFETGDYDGVIKAYRKVIEGFRNYLKKSTDAEGKSTYKHLIDNSDSRTEIIVEFLSKSYSLLSNFGEHYGTKGFEEEAVFTQKLVESISEYLSKKLSKKA